MLNDDMVVCETRDEVPRALREGAIVHSPRATCAIERLLGRGSHGFVFSALNMTVGEKTRRVALKAVLEEERELVAGEELRFSLGAHPNICCYLEHFTAGPHRLFRMELLHCTLFEMIRTRAERPFDELAALRQVCNGLSALHAAGLVHRDLKSENVMLDAESRQLKLIDFGLAKRLEAEGRCSTPTMYTIPYRAPEVALKLAYGTPADVWAAGILGLELASGGELLFDLRCDDEALLLLGQAEFFEVRKLCPELLSNLARTPGAWPTADALEKRVHRKWTGRAPPAAQRGAVTLPPSREPHAAAPPVAPRERRGGGAPHRPGRGCAAGGRRCRAPPRRRRTRAQGSSDA